MGIFCTFWDTIIPYRAESVHFSPWFFEATRDLDPHIYQLRDYRGYLTASFPTKN